MRPPARVPSGRPYGGPQYPRPRPGLAALTATALPPLWRPSTDRERDVLAAHMAGTLVLGDGGQVTA